MVKAASVPAKVTPKTPCCGTSPLTIATGPPSTLGRKLSWTIKASSSSVATNAKPIPTIIHRARLIALASTPLTIVLNRDRNQGGSYLRTEYDAMTSEPSELIPDLVDGALPSSAQLPAAASPVKRTCRFYHPRQDIRDGRRTDCRFRSLVSVPVRRPRGRRQLRQGNRNLQIREDQKGEAESAGRASGTATARLRHRRK